MLLYIYIRKVFREGYKVRKAKKMTKILHLGFLIPPPKCRKIQPIFLSFWHHSEQLWKKYYFFPLKKSKYFIISQNWSSEGVAGTITGLVQSCLVCSTHARPSSASSLWWPAASNTPGQQQSVLFSLTP